MHPPVPGFVDDSATGTYCGGQEFGGCFIWSTGDYQIDTVKAVVCEFFDGEAAAGKFQLLSGAASGGEEAKSPGREATLFEKLQDNSANGTRGSRHSNCIKHGSFPGDLSENQR